MLPALLREMAMWPTSDVCIVVNPWLLVGDLRTRLKRDPRVIFFDDLDALARWRNRCTSTDGIACEVTAVLREIGQDCARLPRDVARAIERLGQQVRTPSVREFMRNETSERTFYRRWNAALPIRPKQFLDRVRLLHALRLIEQLGYSIKEAAALAGYGCPDRLRISVRRAVTGMASQQS